MEPQTKLGDRSQNFELDEDDYVKLIIACNRQTDKKKQLQSQIASHLNRAANFGRIFEKKTIGTVS